MSFFGAKSKLDKAIHFGLENQYLFAGQRNNSCGKRYSKLKSANLTKKTQNFGRHFCFSNNPSRSIFCNVTFYFATTSFITNLTDVTERKIEMKNF